MAAAQAMLDEVHNSLPKEQADSNTYTLGSIEGHNIVIAGLPTDGYGTNNAATVAGHMCRSFPNLRFLLLVGIGGGVPGKVDIRLGDVAVGTKIVQYDLGKTVAGGHFQSTGASYRPHPKLLTALNSSCQECDSSKLVTNRPVREDTTSSRIHYGVMASGNQVIKHSKTRDKWAQELGNICFEMEAAGLMGSFGPCLPIRGTCDYSDSHKSKEWQKHAAAVAAAYTTELLSVIPPESQIIQETGTTALISSTDSARKKLEEHRRNMMSLLRFDQIDARYYSIGAAHVTTCDWLLHHSSYIDWLDPAQFSQICGFLWISGKPGAGKSTLMKLIYECTAQDENEGDTAIISCFFNARGFDLEKSTVGMYRSLLYQLLEEFPGLQGVLDGQQLHRGRLGQRQLICFIDALDECDEDEVRDMVDAFEEIGEHAAKTRINIRTCFSSRHYPHISIRYVKQLILKNQDGHQQDIAKYVRSKFKAGEGEAFKEASDEIILKAAGVFLWVVLVVSILNKEFDRGRIFAVQKRLREIPAGLKALFREILRRDGENMDDLLLCIQWILFAKRPLKCKEFYFAVTSGLDPNLETFQAEWHPKDVPESVMSRFVNSSSKGLAELTNLKDHNRRTVQFIHESVRDFLLIEQGLWELWPHLERDFRSSSHDRIKRCCETSNIFILTRFPFLEYATQYIFHPHRRSGPRAIMKHLNLIAKGSTAQRPLVTAAAQGNVGLVSLLLRSGKVDPNLTDRWSGLTPLPLAVENRHVDFVKLLLETSKVHVDSRTDPEVEDDYGESPLAYALRKKNEDLVKLLEMYRVKHGSRYN
ncbi:hypothetical protein B0T22DRAFT_519409 [Podospora appendiculata]|uniref:Nucleoside phosphorylase domain-containing protein n=1 Tax=Podospora appendiculata TaxID=314037 RepID=A0AAE0X288_9PEZI|nr:hypothetical protein B0T22DRAFT_519409 [Podospora appendiculata]